MADREKVIKGMECILSDGKCDLMNCQYGEVGSCIDAVLSDALALLKEQQEAVEPRVSTFEQRCGNCNKVIEMDGWQSCPWCGKRIDWKGWWKKNGNERVHHGGC